LIQLRGGSTACIAGNPSERIGAVRVREKRARVYNPSYKSISNKTRKNTKSRQERPRASNTPAEATAMI